MAVNYEITQMRNGLGICVRKDMKFWGRVLASSFFGVLALFYRELELGCRAHRCDWRIHYRKRFAS
jgi:hypothetical protein